MRRSPLIPKPSGRLPFRGLLPVALVWVGACAATQRPAVTDPAQAAAPAVIAPPSRAPDATGVWDWVVRSTTQQATCRSSRRWHLEQQGSRLTGYYHRQVMTMSTDQRPFPSATACSASSKRPRPPVRGDSRRSGHLREVGVDTERNLRQPAAQAQGYSGRLQG